MATQPREKKESRASHVKKERSKTRNPLYRAKSAKELVPPGDMSSNSARQQQILSVVPVKRGELTD